VKKVIKKNNKKNMLKRFDANTIVKYCLFALLIIGLNFVTLSPKFVDFRNSIGYFISLNIIITSIIIYLSYKKIDMPLLGKLTIICYAVIIWVFIFTDIGRIRFLIYMVYAFINISIAIYIYIKIKIEFKSIWVFGALAYLSSFSPILKTNTIDTSFPFWQPAIVITILALSSTLLLMIKKPNLIEEKQDKIFVPLLAIIAGFIIPWLCICTLNFTLDQSTPTYESFIIIDKKIQTGSRSITSYELKVQRNEKSFYISVDDSVYYSFEIGDEFNLAIYNGAFNVKYYIYEKRYLFI